MKTKKKDKKKDKEKKGKSKRIKKDDLLRLITTCFESSPSLSLNYKQVSKHTIAEGVFTRRSNGKNSFIPDGEGTPVFIAERNSAHAMDGDRVKVQLLARRKGAEPEGEVVEILESKERVFVGKLQVAKGFAFLITENKTLANDIFIPKDKLKGGKNGDKAVVRIMEWPDDAKNPLGEVIDILGKAGSNNAEMHAILAEFGLPYKECIDVYHRPERCQGL